MIRRQANRVGHELARASCLYTSRHYFYNGPPCIAKIIVKEMQWVCLGHKGKNDEYDSKILKFGFGGKGN